jgi:hypothetical protein
VPRLTLRGRDGKELDEAATFVRKVVGPSASRKQHAPKGRRAAGV